MLLWWLIDEIHEILQMIYEIHYVSSDQLTNSAFFFLQEIKEFCYFSHSLQIKFMIFPAANKWNVCYFLWHIDKIRLSIISRHYVLEKQHNLCRRSLMKIVLPIQREICVTHRKILQFFLFLIHKFHNFFSNWQKSCFFPWPVDISKEYKPL